MARNYLMIIAAALVAIFAVIVVLQNVGPETSDETAPPIVPPAGTAPAEPPAGSEYGNTK